MLTGNDSLTKSFQLLATIVAERSGRQLPCVGAVLKPQLQRYGFTERQLGFLKFGDFLRAAARAGYIQLTMTPGGDLQAHPAASASTASSALSGSAGATLSIPQLARPFDSLNPVRVRQDLWNAFTSFTSAWVYDVTLDAASREGSAMARAAIKAIPIPPGRDRFMEWARAFSSTQEPEVTERILKSLEGDSVLFTFKTTVHSDSRLQRAWHRYHVKQVIAAIEAWASAHNVRPKNIFQIVQRVVPTPTSALSTSATLAPLTSSEQKAASDGASPNAFDNLSPRTAELIDDLISKLLELRGLMEVVKRK